MCTVRTSRLCGRFPLIKSSPVVTLSRLSFGVQGNYLATLIKPSKTKGAALVHLVTNLLSTASNSLSILKVSIGTRSRTIRSELDCVPRGFKLCRRLSIDRGVGLCTSLRNVPLRIEARQFRGLLRVAKLTGFAGHRTNGLSNNVGRGLDLTYALIHSPRLLLLSRPAMKMSPFSEQRL